MYDWFPGKNLKLKNLKYKIKKKKKKTIRKTSIPKIGRFIAAFRSYRPKTLKNGYFGQK